MKTLEIDLETRSDRDITKCGVYAYADSPYFAITLMSVAVDGGAVQLYDLSNGDRVPENILSALVDESVVKRAFHVNFERVCLSKYLREERPQLQRGWRYGRRLSQSSRLAVYHDSLPDARSAVHACLCGCGSEAGTTEDAGGQGAHQVFLCPLRYR